MIELSKEESRRLFSLRSKLDECAEAYNEAHAKLDAFREATFQRMMAHYEAQSEAWKESDDGQALMGWMDDWCDPEAFGSPVSTLYPDLTESVQEALELARNYTPGGG